MTITHLTNFAVETNERRMGKEDVRLQRAIRTRKNRRALEVATVLGLLLGLAGWGVLMLVDGPELGLKHSLNTQTP
jgi:hypothetical protein